MEKIHRGGSLKPRTPGFTGWKGAKLGVPWCRWMVLGYPGWVNRIWGCLKTIGETTNQNEWWNWKPSFKMAIDGVQPIFRYSHMLFLYLGMYCPVSVAWAKWGVVLQLYKAILGGCLDNQGKSDWNHEVYCQNWEGLPSLEGWWSQKWLMREPWLDGGRAVCFSHSAHVDSRDGWHPPLLD